MESLSCIALSLHPLTTAENDLIIEKPATLPALFWPPVTDNVCYIVM